MTRWPVAAELRPCPSGGPVLVAVVVALDSSEVDPGPFLAHVGRSVPLLDGGGIWPGRLVQVRIVAWHPAALVLLVEADEVVLVARLRAEQRGVTLHGLRGVAGGEKGAVRDDGTG